MLIPAGFARVGVAKVSGRSSVGIQWISTGDAMSCFVRHHCLSAWLVRACQFAFFGLDPETQSSAREPLV